MNTFGDVIPLQKGIRCNWTFLVYLFCHIDFFKIKKKIHFIYVKCLFNVLNDNRKLELSSLKSAVQYM